MPLSPVLAIGGGVLIGTAAALLFMLTGRIAGVTGLAAAATGISEDGPPRREAALFVIGLPLGAAIIGWMMGRPEISMTASVPLLIGGGLLVGFGTRLGNGCTSGHGVCGMARLSPRSIAATVMFMATGFATVFIVRHVITHVIGL